MSRIPRKLTLALLCGLTVLWLSLLSSSSTLPLPSEYRFEVFSAQAGLPQNSVYSILQTRDGYLWITTLDGLVRYNGERFKVFDKTTSGGINSSRFTRLFEDRDGSLWICTEDGGLTRYAGCAFVTYTTEHGLPGNWGYSLRRTAEGDLLVHCHFGLARWQEGRFITLSTDTDSFDSVPGYQGPSGALWYRFGTHLRRIRDGVATTYSIPAYSPDDQDYHQLFEDRDGRLWIGTNQAELLMLNGESMTRFTEKDRLPPARVTSFGEDRSGALWFGTDSGGLARMQGGRFTIMSTSGTDIFNFATIIEQPCLGISSCPLPSGLDIQMKTGSSLTLESNLAFASGQLQFTEKLYGQIILDVIGTGDHIDLPSFGIPGASVGFMIKLGDVVDISVSIGIVVKPSLTLDGTISTTLGLGSSTSPEQSITIKIPDASPVTGNLTPTVDFKIVSNTIGGCLKIAIGPEIALSGGLGPESCEFGASGSIFTGPYVKGCLNVSNPNTCPTFSIPVYVGLNAEIASAIKLCVEL